MPFKGQSITLTYSAWDTSANAAKTGDVANHTIRRMVDGVAGAIAGSPSEVESGEYKITLTAAENSGTMMGIQGVSATGNVIIVPVKWTNTNLQPWAQIQNNTIKPVYYFSSSGADANDGLSPLTPKPQNAASRTIVQGLDPGSVVINAYGVWDLGNGYMIVPQGVRVICGPGEAGSFTGAEGTGTLYAKDYCEFIDVVATNTYLGAQSTGMRCALRTWNPSVGGLIRGGRYTSVKTDATHLGGTAIKISAGTGWRVENVQAIGEEYAIHQRGTGTIIDGCWLRTAGAWEVCRSSPVTNDGDDASCIVTNCYCESNRDEVGGADRSIGLWNIDDTPMAIAGCVVVAIATSDNDAVGIEAGSDGSSHYGLMQVSNTAIYTSAVAGNAYDLSQNHASARLAVDDSVFYDTAKVYGTIVNLSDRAAQAAVNTALPGSPTAGSLGALVKTVGTCLAGITSLAAWLRGLARKDTMDATAKSELNLGGGTYGEATDSQEALNEGHDAIKAKTNTLGTAGVTVRSPVATDGELTLYRKDTYDDDESRAIEFSNAAGTWGNGDITAATVEFKAYHERTDATISLTGSVVTPTGTQKVRVEMTSAESADFDDGRVWQYQVRLTLTNGHIETIVDSTVTAMATLF